MKQIKKLVSVLLVLTLMLSVLAACGNQQTAAAPETEPAQTQTEPQTEPAAEAAEQTQPEEAQTQSEPGYYQLGDKIDDFTVTTYDGKEISLYQLLEEKEMVLVNLWATWCGPCGMEFPAMQQAYEKYQDKVEIVALSTYEMDTDDVLADYAQQKGMTFCVARDTAGVASRIFHTGIPTSFIVDRFGTICLIETGAMTDPGIFTKVFDLYTAEDYAESVYLRSMHSEKPNVQPADPAKLNEALNAEGGELVFTNSANAYDWPMTVANVDGRSVAAATNTAAFYSNGVVETQVEAKAGDVLVVEYKLRSEYHQNLMRVKVDGKVAKESAVTKDWNTFAYRFEEGGSHKVSVIFDLTGYSNSSANGLWIDSIRVVSGQEAEAALAANPKYPVAETTDMQLLNDTAKDAIIYLEADPSANAPIHICPDKTLKLLVTLDETADPEVSYVENMNNGNVYPLAECAGEDGFLVEIPNATQAEKTMDLYLYCNGVPQMSISIFPSEDCVDQYFAEYLRDYGESILWKYPDDAAAGEVTYTVAYVDQNGDPVPGVMCQVCDETMCQVFTSDANGICKFTLPAKAYEIHTLMVPEGYEGDTTTITNAPAQGGELTFTLTKK